MFIINTLFIFLIQITFIYTQTISCDTTTATICTISAYHKVINKVTVINNNNFDELHVTGTIECTDPLCEININSFNIITIDGFILGSNISVFCNKLIVNRGAAINATGRGYKNKEGVGYSNIFGTGAGHADYGGYCNNQPFKKYGNYIYPTTFGSGCDFSEGGGIIYVKTNEIIVSGTISTNGVGGFCGGSGGSILIETGILYFDGGTYISSGGKGTTGGGGSGGYVTIYYVTTQPLTRTSNNYWAFGGTSSECRAGRSVSTRICENITCINGITYSYNCDCTCINEWKGKKCDICYLVSSKANMTDCSCPYGYTGINCDICDSNMLCDGFSTCVESSPLVFKCTCDDYYYGYGNKCDRYCKDCPIGHECNVFGSCEFNCTKYPCMNGGTCKNTECSCSSNYYGNTCENFCSGGITCNGNGICGALGKCLCSAGGEGEFCTLKKMSPGVIAGVVITIIIIIIAIVSGFITKKKNVTPEEKKKNKKQKKKQKKKRKKKKKMSILNGITDAEDGGNQYDIAAANKKNTNFLGLQKYSSRTKLGFNRP